MLPSSKVREAQSLLPKVRSLPGSNVGPPCIGLQRVTSPGDKRLEVPSEKPKHKNNSMSKNKIPSSEVPGAKPLPVAGTSPFPGSWRSQARLTQSGSARQPSPAPHTRTPSRGGAVRRPSAPPCGRGRHRRPREEAAAGPREPKSPGHSRSLRGPLPPPSRCQAEPGAHTAPTSARHSPPPTRVRPERKCASLLGPP